MSYFSVFCSSKTGGTLLHIENSDGDVLSISVFLDQVAVTWRLSPSQEPEVRRFRKSEPDFDWTRIHIIISNNQIRGKFQYIFLIYTNMFFILIFINFVNRWI